MKMYKKMAKSISYDPRKRKKSTIKYIVIHYTAGSNDTAKNEVDYFAKYNNREAGAHFFVDREGKIGRSIPMNRTAWAVGGNKYPDTKGGKYYGKCNNYNSVSIELCAINTRYPSEKQTKAVKKLIKYIHKYCKNIPKDNVIRHYDVTGKVCPSIYAKPNSKKWKEFRDKVK